MRVGIITMLHDSCNYGGILQAYAMTKVLEQMGVESEQIYYKLASAYPIKRRMKITAKKYLNELRQIRNLPVVLKLHKRKRIIRKIARNFIPHSKEVYSERTIRRCVDKYDAFITGSDQVWSQNWPAYFLDFVPEGKTKIAYAVSVGNSTLPQNEVDYINRYSKTFKAISVREEDSAEKLDGVIKEKKIKTALDPTLLLNSEDWEAISSPRLVSGEYLLCYFLGTDNRLRQLALEYAEKNNLKLVTIPHMQQKVETNDLGFGDEQVYFASPRDFLSYIKYSQTVFTDSFHACVFSQVFKRQYYVFGRSEFANMNNRIITLTRMFGTESHFISNEEEYSFSHISSIQDIDYTVSSDNYLCKKQNSLQFLEDNLKLKPANKKSRRK